MSYFVNSRRITGCRDYLAALQSLLRRNGLDIQFSISVSLPQDDGGLDIIDIIAQRQSTAIGQPAGRGSRLTGGVAHDFNNLLAAVLGGLRLLEARLTLGDRERQIFEHMRHAAESGAELVRRLMAFARKQELTPTGVDPRRLCDSVAGLAAHALGGKFL